MKLRLDFDQHDPSEFPLEPQIDQYGARKVTLTLRRGGDRVQIEMTRVEALQLRDMLIKVD